jgi:hypothetical protein
MASPERVASAAASALSAQEPPADGRDAVDADGTSATAAAGALSIEAFQRAAREHRCADVLRLAADIRARAPDDYERHIAPSPALRACRAAAGSAP